MQHFEIHLIEVKIKSFQLLQLNKKDLPFGVKASFALCPALSRLLCQCLLTLFRPSSLRPVSPLQGCSDQFGPSSGHPTPARLGDSSVSTPNMLLPSSLAHITLYLCDC